MAEDAFAWRKVAPLLARQGRLVVMLDPRGFGDSDKPETGYDSDTVANEVHAFIAAAGLRRPGGIDVVTHDIGGWIGYALASSHPEDVRRLVLSEVGIPIPGQAQPVPTDDANLKTWQFSYNRLPGLPEMLVAGRERAFLNWLFDHKAVHPATIDAASRAEYVRAYAEGAARPGFEYYRAMFSSAGMKRTAERRSSALRMPLMTIGGGSGVGDQLMQSMRGAATDLHGVVLEGCGHYLPDECPVQFAGAVTVFWKSTDSARR